MGHWLVCLYFMVVFWAVGEMWDGGREQCAEEDVWTYERGVTGYCGKLCAVEHWWLLFLAKYHDGGKIKNDWIGGPCDTHGKEQTCFMVLVGNREDRRLLGGPRRRWEGSFYKVSQCQCPRHISHGLTCDSTRASTMRSRRPIFCYIARLREHIIKKVVERREYIELIWLRRDTNGGLLWTR